MLKPYLVSYILKCNYNKNFSKKCQIFTGFNCVSKMLYNLLTTDNDYINDVIEKYFNKEIENNPDLSKFNRNICHLCNKKIFKKPVRNHCHYSGKMLGFARNKCNLQYKFPKDNVNNKYLISVFAHNTQNFDNSFLIKALNNIENVNFSALPRNSNKFISLDKKFISKIENFIFKDSFLFLNKSLDYLTKTIDDEDRVSLKQEFEKNYEVLTKKGIYPYDYFDNIKKYNETKIPDHTNFENKLNNNKNVSNTEYKHAIKVFKTFKCKNLLDYSILYLKTDVCHLADVFQKFSNFAYKTYGLDCRYSYTLPGYSWQCMLKLTKIELDLISDQDMYLFLLDSIRGGICQVNKKYSKTDNKYTRNQHKEWKNKKIQKQIKNK